MIGKPSKSSAKNSNIVSSSKRGRFSRPLFVLCCGISADQRSGSVPVILYRTVSSDFRNIVGGVQADSADGAIIAETVLGLCGVISRKHHGDVTLVNLSRAGRINTACEESLRIAYDRLSGWDRGANASSRNSVRIQRKRDWEH